MPEEIEVPMEHLHEHIAEVHEELNGEPHEHKPEGWIRYIAVVTAVLAVVAAIGALQSGLLINESLLQKNEQIRHLTEASDTWNYYQAEGIKSLIYSTTAQTLPHGGPGATEDLKQSAHYRDKQTDLKATATELTETADLNELKSERFLEKHHVFAISVSLCQIAIAMSAVAALTRRRGIWLFGLAAGTLGVLLLCYGFLPSPAALPRNGHAAKPFSPPASTSASPR